MSQRWRVRGAVIKGPVMFPRVEKASADFDAADWQGALVRAPQALGKAATGGQVHDIYAVVRVLPRP